MITPRSLLLATAMAWGLPLAAQDVVPVAEPVETTLGDADAAARSDAAPPEAPDDTPPALRPTLAEIFAPPTLLGLRPSDASVSADGRWATWRWTAEHTDEPERDVWLAPTDGSVEPRVLFEHDDGVSLRWARAGALLIVQRDGWIETLDVDAGDGVRPLMQAGRVRDLELLDDDRRALVLAGDHTLWVLDLLSGERRLLAAELEDRAGELQLLPELDAVALFARPAPEPEATQGDRTSGAHDDAAHGTGTGTGDDADVDAQARRGADATRTRGRPADQDAPTATDDAPADPAARRLHVIPLDGSPPRALPMERTPGARTRLSPTARWALLQSSERDVGRELVMADYLSDHVQAVPVRSSLAGDDADAVTLTLVDTRDGSEHPLPLDEAERYYVQRLAWSPVEDLLLVDRLSNDFHVRELLVVDPLAGTGRLLHSARDDAWIGGPFRWSTWSHDGRAVVFTSERTGWNQLYAVDPREGQPRALTEGPWELQRVTPVPDSDRWLVLGTRPDDPATIRLLAASTDGDPPAVLHDAPAVVSRVRASRDGSTALFDLATLARPADLHALRFAEPTDGAGRAGALLSATPDRSGPLLQPSGRRSPAPVALSASAPAALAELGAAPPRVVEYVNPDDGTTVRAYLYLPPGVPDPFAEGGAPPAQPLPLVVFVHGAGYLQQVTRSMSQYEVNLLFHQRLAAKGYVVLDPDFRHSKGYGRDFRADVHGHMGGKDLDDVVAGVRWLVEAGLVDAERVGIYGGSYGGFLTLMALFTKPDDFSCGAALRSVTDWRTYNHWYTNPRLGHPERDAEAYAKSSPIDLVDGLEDPLLLLHGLVDGNVFAQDTIRLMEELVQRGKDFDVMLYPSQGHGFDDPASWIDEYKRIERLFDTHLRP